MNGCWVLGGSGLLGSAIRRQLSRHSMPVFIPDNRIRWRCSNGVAGDLRAALNQFSQQLSPGSPWTVYWAAGVGAMNSSFEELAAESNALGILLDLICNHHLLQSTAGSIVFSSSAGAIYAGTTDHLVSESSSVGPNTPYGHEKLKQEDLLHQFQVQHGSIKLLIARLSTIYGPGQSNGKGQGLITMIARRMLRNQVINIYVPLDTLRDYIAVDDAADAMIHSLDSLPEGNGAYMRIIAAGQSTSISQVVQTFRRIARHPPKVALSSHSLSHIYAKQLNFQSDFSEVIRGSLQTGFAVGIAQVYEHERQYYSISPIFENQTKSGS